MHKIFVGTWLVEVVIVVIVCRFSASAELPWICSVHFVISASKEISGEVFFSYGHIASFCDLLPTSSCWPVRKLCGLDEKSVFWELTARLFHTHISSAHLKHCGGVFVVPVNSEECELLIYFAYFISFRTLSLGFLGFFFCKIVALTDCTSS